MANYRFTNPTEEQIPSGSVINQGNFAQLEPDTPIMVGRVLTINGGNWINVRQDPNWTINGGNWQQKSRCTHVLPNLIEHGKTPCAVDCSHIVASHDIIIDGQLIETIREYEDTPV